MAFAMLVLSCGTTEALERVIKRQSNIAPPSPKPNVNRQGDLMPESSLQQHGMP
nr:hypothetical protein Itr_chr12CG10870 [Ipomoea trifida]